MTRPILYDTTSDGTGRSIAWVLLAAALFGGFLALEAFIPANGYDMRSDSGPRKADMAGVVPFEKQ